MAAARVGSLRDSNFTRVPVGASIQRKPSVSTPGDAFELEADTAADHVMRMAEPASLGATRPTIQRKCAACDDEKKKVQTKRASSGDAAHAPDAQTAASAATHGGAPLAPEVRSYFEPRFGHDFSRVRVHTDGEAAGAARAVHARAYTYGSDVVFAAGEYAPASPGGRHLLAHELAHVVQQGGTRAQANATPTVQRQEKKPAESETLNPLVQKLIKGEATQQEKDTLRKQLESGQLSEADIEALKKNFATEFASSIAKAVQGQAAKAGKAAPGGAPARFNVTIGGEIGNVHTFFKAALRVRMSGAAKVFAGGLEGTVETTIEVTGDKNSKSVTVKIQPPAGDTSLAALIRAKAFPNGGPVEFHLGEGVLKALNMISLQGDLTFTVTGNKDSEAGGLVVMSPDVPSGVELLVTVSQSDEKPQTAASTGSSALPPRRLFATAGVTKPLGGGVRLGFDLPLATDTEKPFKYVGVGARASVDTQPTLSAGVIGFGGIHLSPITLQVGIEAGVIHGPVPNAAPGVGPKTSPYFGAEVSVGYKVLKHLEIMTLGSIIGGSKKEQPGSASVQIGAAYTF
jgi:hypothetical protein